MRKETKDFLISTVLYASGLAEDSKENAGDNNEQLIASQKLLEIYSLISAKLNNDEALDINDWSYVFTALLFVRSNMAKERDKLSKIIVNLDGATSGLKSLIADGDAEKINKLFQSNT